MGVSEVIINEQALSSVSSSITAYVVAYREAILTAVRGLKANGGEWSDEDYNALVSAVNSFLTDVDGIDNATKQLVVRIDNKISAIHALHNMKI